MDDKDAAQDVLAFIDCPLGKYEHYKGPHYWVFAKSIDETTLEPLVHYESLIHGTCWTRTIKNFTEKVDGIPRFRWIGGDKNETRKDEAWKSYAPLFQWRDNLTERYGEDLASLLSSLGEDPRDFRLPKDLETVWDVFGSLSEKTRQKYAEAFVADQEDKQNARYGSE